MTRIEKIDVDGFKGLTDTSLEFGGINVITGRNNTGKTSLLEAIELGLEPERLEAYGDQVGNLINVYLEECDIEISLSDGQSLLSLEFVPPEEALEFTIDTSPRINSSFTFPNVPEDVNLSDAIKRVLRSELENMDIEEVPGIGRVVIDVSYNDKNFKAINSGKVFKQLISNRESRIRNILESEINFNEWQEQVSVDDVLEYIKFFTPSTSHVKFHPESPEGHDGILFIERAKTIRHHDSGDEEDGSAIKKVEIRDYLNEHEITPEPDVTVEDFDFDVIVFEKDGERYQVPYDFMGDGFKTIVGILWQFLGEDDIADVVLMEEPENNMHPGYVSELVPFLVDVAREEDVQLFLTTHNVDFISEFFAEFPEETWEYLESEFRLIQMTETVPKTFDYADAKEQVEDLHLDLRGI